LADALATLLVQEGAVSLEALAEAQARQRELGGALDTALLELGFLSEEELIEALARASGLPPATPEALLEPDPRSRRVFPSRVAERHGLAPFRLEGRELHLAASWPVDQAALDEISFMLSLSLVPHVAPELRVRELRRRVYDAPLPERFQRLAAQLAALPSSRPPAPSGPWPVTQLDLRPPAPSGPWTATRLDLRPPPPPAPAPTPPAPPAEAAVAPEPLAVALAQAVQQAEAAVEEEPPAPPARSAEDRSRPPRWDLEAARQALAAAARRDDAVEALLRYARDFFEHAALLAVSRDRLHGHDALGHDPQARDRARAVSAPVGPGGIFRAVLDTGGPYLGPPGRDPALDAVIAGLGRAPPRTVLLYPVLVRERVVCVLYADNGEAPVSPRRVGDLLLLAGSLGGELVRILREHKARSEAAWQAVEPGRTQEGPGAGPEPGAGEPEDEEEELEAPPPFDPVDGVRRLVESARGSPERGRLVALLVQHGPEAAAELARALPGPIDARGAAREESLPVDERGPVLAALAALGIVATPYLVSTLGDPDPTRRRCAAMLLGHIADPAGFLGLADLAFDPSPAVGEAALEALERVRLHPDFRPVLERLRRSLLGEPPRPAFAARALVRLRDAGAVPALIALLDGAPATSDAAADALEALTARSFGKDAALWSAWWTAHRGQGRADWLFEALADRDRAVRLAGAEALRALGPSPVRYFADAPEEERLRAAREWRAWFEGRGIEA
jgi:hypothetical protein